MKVSLSWLSDYVKLPAADALAKKLTFAGLEIEGVHRLGEGLAGVVVAQILESAQHPNADKLSVTKVDAGAKGTLQIVCGAKNYKVGDKVPLATVGTKLPNGTEIKAAQLRGVDSFGMLCSARELGLSEEHAGLLILDPSLAPGTAIAQALGLDDTVFELNVTPNRADALSHLGVAREVAVLTKQPLKLPEAGLHEASELASAKAKVRIEEADRCPRYAARVIEGVTVGPSPAWLANRLKACGVRSINNVVDVTNYVLLEYGHPLHGFDLDKLAGAEIVVRRAKGGEKLVTLDGKERALDADDLLICDAAAPQAIAGVMGGGPSEVSPGTTRILLESAYFQPATVRRSSKRHALHTEASHRFERGADLSAVPLALDRAAALIAELGKGRVLKGAIDVYPKPAAPREVTLRNARPEEVLGMPVSIAESKETLAALGFKEKRIAADSITYEVPSFRVDVEREEDLIEELARIKGYDAVPLALPKGASGLVPEAPVHEAERRIRLALAGAGFDEVVNYSFVSPKHLEALGETATPIALQNPLSVEQSVMRTSIFPGLLQNAAHALRHQVEDVRLYELGRVYTQDAAGGQHGRPVAFEKAVVGGVVAGLREPRTWTAKEARADFYDAKGAVEAVLAALHISGATFVHAVQPAYHPRASAEVRDAKGNRLGFLGELQPRAVKKLDLPGAMFVFELDVEALLAASTLVPAYRALTRYPAVLRDIAVVVGTDLQSDAVQKVILEVGSPLVEDALLFDVYTGKPLPEGKKNLAYALRYRAKDRTLRDEEVAEAHAKIVAEVNQRLGADLRA
jgi:phenylalanyl-tRNA synthetase beta chain